MSEASDALRSAAVRLSEGNLGVQMTNGIGWIPLDTLGGAAAWLNAEAARIDAEDVTTHD